MSETAIQNIEKTEPRRATKKETAIKSREEREILDHLSKLKKELDFSFNSFDTLQDEYLIDSLIYEMMSIEKKYQYYLKMAKEKGLIAVEFNKLRKVR